MRFEILGALRVGDGAVDPAVTAGRDRVVLAMLLLRPNRVVPVDQLIDAMWEAGPPATARGQLQSCISRLRRVLPAAGVPATAIVSDPAGYSIQVTAEDLDAMLFTELVARARERAEDRPEQASKLFRAALDLWRGPALAGMSSAAVRHRAAVLDEQQVVAVEDWVDVELRLGAERGVLGELSALIERYPLRERLRGQLMLALAQAGQQGEALAEYRRARDVLRAELGIEPGAALQAVHRRVLGGQVPAPAVAATPAADRPERVRTLPRMLVDFTGRTAVVDRLRRAVDEADAFAPVVQVIDGMPGSGKTALAVHVGNLLAARYPDAQLFIDLHGHSERSPVEPATALAILLRQLQVPGELIPADFDERVLLWRREIGSRRALVILDNAASSAQVRPLLPAEPGCLVLVTSRRRLTGLDGVRPESLGVLPAVEAVDLLVRIAGQRVRAEPAAAAEVVRRCGGLPLAIRLAGSRLAHRPRWRVAELTRRLGVEHAVLSELTAEDRAVARAFALSYDHLAEPEQRMFRLLGLYPADDFDAAAIAALAELTRDRAQDMLDDLVDQHLLEETGDGRFRLHDLIREYVHELVQRLPVADRRAAEVRLFDYYLHAAVALSRHQEPPSARRTFQPAAPLRPDLRPPPGTVGAEWIARERAALHAVSRRCHELGEDAYTWLIARASWRLWYAHGYYDDLIATHERALTAARRLDDDLTIGLVANYLASGYYRVGRLTEAIDLMEEAVSRLTTAGNPVATALAGTNLAAILADIGRLDRARYHVNRSLEVCRRSGNIAGLGHAAHASGIIAMRRMRPREALRWHRLALLLHRQAGTELQRVIALGNVAHARATLGEHGPAMRQLRVALALARRAGAAHGEAEILNNMGTVRRGEGALSEALDLHRQALQVAQRVGERRLESIVTNDYAETLRAAGDVDAALALHRRALALAMAVRYPFEQARALDGIADGAGGDDGVAYRQQAVAIRRDMGLG